jgi:hypothetical protein
LYRKIPVGQLSRRQPKSKLRQNLDQEKHRDSDIADVFERLSELWTVVWSYFSFSWKRKKEGREGEREKER